MSERLSDRRYKTWLGAVTALIAVVSPHAANAQQSMKGGQMISPGLVMPSMDAANGRKLFASKGCVVCHSVNGVGGGDAPPLDASTMIGMTNPFDFAANMWRGAEPMIQLQREELGSQIEFTGQELSDIIAFLHDEAEEKKFSETDIPPAIKEAMAKMENSEESNQRNMNGMPGMTMPGMKMGP